MTKTFLLDSLVQSEKAKSYAELLKASRKRLKYSFFQEEGKIYLKIQAGQYENGTKA